VYRNWGAEMNAILERSIIEKLHQLDEKNLYQVMDFINEIKKNSLTVRDCKGMLANRKKDIPQDEFSQVILQDDMLSR
jgi:hypothetical protein